jgi:hypothetical protein
MANNNNNFDRPFCVVDLSHLDKSPVIRCNKNDHMDHYFYDFNAYQTIFDIALIPKGDHTILTLNVNDHNE